MNRLVVDKGVLSGTAGTPGTTILRGTGGQSIAYDALGQRTSVASTGYVAAFFDPYAGYIPGLYYESGEIYNYDGAGRLLEIRDTRGTFISETSYTGTPPAAPSGATDGTQLSTFTYDLMGRQLTQNDYSGTSVVYSRTTTYNATGQVTAENTSLVRSDGTFTTSTTNSFISSASEYFLGAVASSSASTYKNGTFQATASTTYTYYWRDGPLQSSIQYKPNPSATIQYTSLMYDAAGALLRAQINDGRPRVVTYRTNAEGQIVHRYENAINTSLMVSVSAPGYVMAPSWNTDGPHEIWYRFGGREWGYLTNNGTTKVGTVASIADRRAVPGSGAFRGGASAGTSYADFAQSYDPINSYGQGSSAGSYTVQRTGESLSSIASALWGDSSLWYKLAEANGLAAETNLVEGQRLTIPAGVIRNAHNANTFRPYNAAEAIGDVQPSVPIPVAPKKKGCGIGAIFLAIIAVAVTIVTAGATFAAAASAATGTSVSLGAGISLALGGTVAGVTATTAGLVVVGAASAAVGSIVSQGIGVMTGIQEKFSWGAVALAGIGGLVGGGVTMALGPAASLSGAVVRGVLTNSITQGIGVATGLQDKFNWAGVAAAGVGAGVGFQVGQALGKGTGFFASGIGNEIASSGAAMLARAATRSAIEGSSFGDNILAALPDAIGSVVGRALGEGVISSNTDLGKAEAKKKEAKAGPADQKVATTGDQVAAALEGNLGWNLPTDLGLNLTLPDLSGLAGGAFNSGATISEGDEIVVRALRSVKDARRPVALFSNGSVDQEIATLNSSRTLSPVPDGAQAALEQALRANPAIKGSELAAITQSITDQFLPGYKAAGADAWEGWLAGGFRKTGTVGRWSYEKEPSILSQLAGEIVSTPAGTALLSELNEGSFGIVSLFDSQGMIEATGRKNPNAAAAGAIIGMIAGGGVDAGTHAVESATVRAARLGREGEQAVGLFGPKVGIRIPGSNRLRIPDNLDLTTRTLTEVKNVGYQGYTRQLRDFAAYSQNKKLTFELYVRPSTRLSRALNEAIIRGEIIKKYIPGAK